MRNKLSTEERLKRKYIIVIDLIVFFICFSLAIIIRYVYLTYLQPNKVLDIKAIATMEFDANADMANTVLEIRNTLAKHYEVDILYDISTAPAVEDVGAKVITDNRITFEMLKTINETFAKYPQDIFKEIEARGYDIVIYLVDHFENDNIALANRTSAGRFNVFLSNDYELSKAFHHEIYHILEYYMKLENKTDGYFFSWLKENPIDFEYTYDVSKITKDYVYGKDFSGNELSFITAYSKYSDTEDRAETFSEMMINNTDFTIISNAQNIVDKMKLLANQLMNSFASVQDDSVVYYWERHIK